MEPKTWAWPAWVSNSACWCLLVGGRRSQDAPGWLHCRLHLFVDSPGNGSPSHLSVQISFFFFWLLFQASPGFLLSAEAASLPAQCVMEQTEKNYKLLINDQTRGGFAPRSFLLNTQQKSGKNLFLFTLKLETLVTDLKFNLGFYSPG